jgi:hypothetical protein
LSSSTKKDVVESMMQDDIDTGSSRPDDEVEVASKASRLERSEKKSSDSEQLLKLISLKSSSAW